MRVFGDDIGICAVLSIRKGTTIGIVKTRTKHPLCCTTGCGHMSLSRETLIEVKRNTGCIIELLKCKVAQLTQLLSKFGKQIAFDCKVLRFY